MTTTGNRSFNVTNNETNNYTKSRLFDIQKTVLRDIFL